MAAIDYDRVSPLVAATERHPSSVLVTFRCPATGTEVRAEGRYPERGLVDDVVRNARQSVFGTLRTSIASSLRRAIGSTGLASVGAEAATQIAYQAGREHDGGRTEPSDKDVRAAVVAAFANVADRFAWDEGAGRYVAASAAEVEASPFDAHIAAHPLNQPYDRDVLARLLAAMVASDGVIGDDERASFSALVPGASLDELAAKRPPGPVDFEETTAGPSRETMLLLAWAVALSDESQGDAERALLDVAAAGLGVTEDRAAELKAIAQRHVISTAIAALAARGADVDVIRADVEALGEAIGLGADEAARAVIRWRKRAGVQPTGTAS